jgi:hypothetical protein
MPPRPRSKVSGCLWEAFPRGRDVGRTSTFRPGSELIPSKLYVRPLAVRIRDVDGDALPLLGGLLRHLTQSMPRRAAWKSSNARPAPGASSHCPGAGHSSARWAGCHDRPHGPPPHRRSHTNLAQPRHHRITQYLRDETPGEKRDLLTRPSELAVVRSKSGVAGQRPHVQDRGRSPQLSSFRLPSTPTWSQAGPRPRWTASLAGRDRPPSTLLVAFGSGYDRPARLPPPARQGAVGRSSVPAQVVEEVLDDVELPGAGRLVVDVFADGEVEYAEAEG